MAEGATETDALKASLGLVLKNEEDVQLVLAHAGEVFTDDPA
jgi:hypothetical protein